MKGQIFLSVDSDLDIKQLRDEFIDELIYLRRKEVLNKFHIIHVYDSETRELVGETD